MTDFMNYQLCIFAAWHHRVMNRLLIATLVALIAVPLHAAPMPSRVAAQPSANDVQRVIVRLAELGCDSGRIASIVQRLDRDDARQLANHLDQLQRAGLSTTARRAIIIAAVVAVVVLILIGATTAALAGNIG